MASQSTRARLSEQSGQILILTAVSMVALLGVAALTLDASFMFAKRNRLHAAADAAAKSAAMEVARNSAVSLASLEAFADQQVLLHGFTPSRFGGTTSVVINHGPSSGPFAGNARYVEAIVSEPTSTFFGKILGWVSMTPGAVTVAGTGNPSNCLVTQQDLSIGNITLTLNGCGVGVGGNLSGTNPNAEIVGTPTPSVGVTGTCGGTCSGMGSLTTGAPVPADPLAGLPFPTNSYTCSVGVGPVLSEGCYSSIASTVTTLNAGTYYVTGRVNINSLTGTNVTIFLAAGGYLDAGNNSTLTLTGPATGTYAGIVIFQDRTNALSFDANNGFTLDVTGAIYMPGVDIDFKNSMSIAARNCTLIFAKSLTVKNGNGALNSSGCAGAFGGAAFLSASIAQ